jgi:hypothetical protein
MTCLHAKLVAASYKPQQYQVMFALLAVSDTNGVEQGLHQMGDWQLYCLRPYIYKQAASEHCTEAGSILYTWHMWQCSWGGMNWQL